MDFLRDELFSSAKCIVMYLEADIESCGIGKWTAVMRGADWWQDELELLVKCVLRVLVWYIKYGVLADVGKNYSSSEWALVAVPRTEFG